VSKSPLHCRYRFAICPSGLLPSPVRSPPLYCRLPLELFGLSLLGRMRILPILYSCFTTERRSFGMPKFQPRN